MQRITLLNPKGGCGKTTIATNLAAYFAGDGEATTLIDHDAQGSSSRWLELRAENRAPVHGVPAYKNLARVTRSWQLRLPADTEKVVVDTPAAVQGQRLVELIQRTDVILVPVLPSLLDVSTVNDFLQCSSLRGQLRAQKTRCALIANRIVAKDISVFNTLRPTLEKLNIPLIATFRDTPLYVEASSAGLGIQEMKSGRTRIDRRQWAPLLQWLDHDHQTKQESFDFLPVGDTETRDLLPRVGDTSAPFTRR